MSRFVYEKLTEHQLRMGVALLNQESAVVEALEDAVSNAINSAIEGALTTFGIDGLDGANARSITGGAAGGARAETTKSRPAARRRTGGKKRARAGSVVGQLASIGIGKGVSKVSPSQLASRKLQGLYIAAIRSVPKSRRAKYKAIVKTAGGRQAAIDAIYGDYPHGGGSK